MTTRIPAYTANAENLCADCVFAAYEGEARAAGWDGAYNYFTGAEPVLDAVAAARGIDRSDERTFDSSEFPKVIFAEQLEGETCQDRECEEDHEGGHPETCAGCAQVIE